MTFFDVFNGDADGICALHQLRLAEPRQAELVTGVKRDISLVQRVDVAKADAVTVLDVSMDKNTQALQDLLDADIPVFYADHHFPGDIPEHKALTAHIDTDANTCTGLIVNRFLQDAHLRWAVTAAFGDNLHTAATDAAKPLDLSATELGQLEELGTLLNYNGYGSALDDLFFKPDDLYRKVQPYENPFDFIAQDSAFITLKDGLESDMQRALAIDAHWQSDHCALFVFPDDPFARRVSGVYSNQLARDNPDRAHALASELPDGNYLVSVRAPLNNKTGADELCMQFPTGGGRKAAAGINKLPVQQLDAFRDAFAARYQSQ